MSLKTQRLYRFGEFSLKPQERVLLRDGNPVPLTPKVFDLLLVLVERHGLLLEKDQLMKEVWPDAFVEESNLTYNISILRKTLGDDGKNERFIETVPKRGYRFVAPVQEQEIAAAAGERPRRRRTLWIPALLLGIAGLAWWFHRSYTRRVRPAVGILKPVPLTSYPGAELHPSFSPDGNQIAFSWNGEKQDNYDIYVKPVGPGRPLRLTEDPAPDVSPVWSPDGRWIAFVRSSPGKLHSIFLVPPLGGPARKVGEARLGSVFSARLNSGPHLCWSGDSKSLVLPHRPSDAEPNGLFVLSVESGDVRRLTSSPALDDLAVDAEPALSPDGRTLAFSRSPGGVGLSDIYLLHVTDRMEPKGEPRRLTFENQLSLSPAWVRDGLSILFVSGLMGQRHMLRRILLSDAGKSQPVDFAGEDAFAPALSRGSSRLAYSQETVDSNIWRMKLPGPQDAARTPEMLISSTRLEKQPQFSPDGKRIAFGSSRSGTEEIWVCDSSGGNAVQLTSFNGPPAGAPRWSPDGQFIAFDAYPEGSGKIYVVSSDGGAPRRLTNDRYFDAVPSWSRDGRWIYFISDRSGTRQVWKMPADVSPATGTAVQVTRQGASFAPFESSDGQFVYYLKRARAGPDLWRISLETSAETKVLEAIEGGGGYALSAEGIHFLTKTEGGSATALRFLPFGGDKIRSIASFRKPVNQLAVSPDGQWILYLQRDAAGADLMLVENFH